MRFVIVTGMSGAGKATALKTLEDAGFFCVDNLPIQLIKRFAEIAYDEQIQVDDVAISVDIRSGRALSQLNSCLADIRREGMNYEILFIECSNATLVKRYKETRRNHPLSVKGGRIIDGINKERELIGFLKEEADYIIDTTNLLVREFKAELDKIFVQNEEYSNFIITVMSFGFKYGIPRDSDIVQDVRFLPNPYYDLELREKTGNDKEIQDYVMNCKEGPEYRSDNIFDTELYQGRQKSVGHFHRLHRRKTQIRHDSQCCLCPFAEVKVYSEDSSQGYFEGFNSQEVVACNNR